MTLSGARAASRDRRYHARPAGMRLSAYLLFTLAVLIVASAYLSTNRGLALAFGVFVAANVAHKAAWSLWAVRSGRIAGTKVLAMIAGVISVAWIIIAWYTEGGATPYFWAALLLGLAAAVVASYDSIVSPDEDRRVAHEPRAPEDVSEFEVVAHGEEHSDGR